MLKLVKSVSSTLTVTDIEQKHVSGQLNSHDVTDAKGIRDVTDGLHGGPSTVAFPEVCPTVTTDSPVQSASYLQWLPRFEPLDSSV